MCVLYNIFVWSLRFNQSDTNAPASSESRPSTSATAIESGDAVIEPMQVDSIEEENIEG